MRLDRRSREVWEHHGLKQGGLKMVFRRVFNYRCSLTGYLWGIIIGKRGKRLASLTQGVLNAKITPAPSASECRSGGINDAKETEDACQMLKRCHIGFLQCHAMNEDAPMMLCVNMRGALQCCSGQACLQRSVRSQACPTKAKAVNDAGADLRAPNATVS